VLAGNSSGYQSFLVLLLSCLIHQDNLRRDRPFPATQTQGRRHQGYLQGLLEGCPTEVDSCDMHDQPQWVNKLLFPPAIKNKRMKPPMTDRLAALIKRVAELRQVGLEACHYVDEFYLRRIRPLGHWKILAFECP
jgi:hypothetical protein